MTERDCAAASRYLLNPSFRPICGVVTGPLMAGVVFIGAGPDITSYPAGAIGFGCFGRESSAGEYGLSVCAMSGTLRLFTHYGKVLLASRISRCQQWPTG